MGCVLIKYRPLQYVKLNKLYVFNMHAKCYDGNWGVTDVADSVMVWVEPMQTSDDYIPALPVVVVGDFNYNMKNKKNPFIGYNVARSTLPTHPTSNTILDFAISNSSDVKLTHKFSGDLTSDHKSQYFKIMTN